MPAQSAHQTPPLLAVAPKGIFSRQPRAVCWMEASQDIAKQGCVPHSQDAKAITILMTVARCAGNSFVGLRASIRARRSAGPHLPISATLTWPTHHQMINSVLIWKMVPFVTRMGKGEYAAGVLALLQARPLLTHLHTIIINITIPWTSVPPWLPRQQP